MPRSSGTTDDHAHAGHEHHHGTHVMPDGTVMAGARHPPAAALKSAATAPPGKQVEYTCPMHPQIRQMGPGSCPICGMTLEPVVATAEPGESPELRDMTRRFWTGLALTAPVFALEMGGQATWH